jgi:hypothetical protein
MMAHVLIEGSGVAAKAAEQLLRRGGHRVSIGSGELRSMKQPPSERAARGLDEVAGPSIDAVIIATPAGTQYDLAVSWEGRTNTVITTSDDRDDVSRLLDLDDRWTETALVVGAAFAPGVSTALAGALIDRFDIASEVHVARFGTGGPSCARQHHRALRNWAPEWRDGQWLDRPGGSGRELVFFPPPIGGADCYRAGVADPLVMHHAFSGLDRISSRLAATRRDRLTSPLPMLRAPHPEGLVGAIRVEVRGWQRDAYAVEVIAATGRPGVVTGVAAASAALETWSAGVSTVAGASGDWLDRVCGAGVTLHEFAPDR